MLLCNGVRIDTSIKEGVHKWVKECMDEIVAKNKLHKGGSVVIKYSDRLITKDPVTGRERKPANIIIDYFEVFFNEKFNELQDWRYCVTMTEKGIGVKPKYYPTNMITSGSKTLGIKDIELIFFLKNISSRVEGGQNSNPRQKTYIRFEDKIKEAEVFVETKRTKLYIENCVIGDHTTGGLSDKDIRNVAAAMVMKDARNDNYPVDMLRRELYNKIQKDAAAMAKIIEFISSVQGPAVQTMSNIAEAKELKLIDVRTIKNAPHWVFLNKDGSTGPKIVKVPAGMISHPEDYLKDFYLDNNEDYNYLLESMEASKKPAKAEK